MKTKTRENERRDSVIIIILILLLGFICIILASGWALRFAPSWKLDTNMGSNLNPNSDFLTSRPIGFFEPLDPAILTKPAWMDVFLTPGVSSVSFPTRTPLPTITATSAPPKTNTPVVPTLIPSATNTLIIIIPTNTKIILPPPPSTATPKPAATNTPLLSADLQITKTDGVVTYIPGNTLTYTITVTNNGLGNITGAIVLDNIPAQITTWDWVCASQTGGATGCNGVVGSNANFSDTVNLPNGASIIYTVTANITANAVGNLTNIATINVPTGYTDPVPGNNSATDTDTLTSDLAITKTDGTTTYTPGNTLTYTVTVTNSGPSAVLGAVVADNIPPAQITTWDWACASQTGGATGCTGVIGSNTDFTDTVNLPNGASIVYTVTANISAGAVGNLVNTAMVNVPAGYIDPILGNNSATDTDTANLQTDLTITKTDASTTYVPGNAITYTIVVSNAGPSNATGASVADTVPAAITGITINCAASGAASCGTNASAGNSLLYTGVNIPSGAANLLTITVNGIVDPATTGNLINTATVTAGAGQTDPTPANNTATDTDTLFVPPTADLQITKTDGVLTYTPGGAPLTYTITVTNNGPSAVIGATVTDVFSAQIASASWTCSSASTPVGTCAASGAGNINETVDLPVNASVTFIVTANTSANALGVISNTAAVAVPSGVTETNAGNNTATDSDTSTNTNPNIGPPDGTYYNPGQMGSITFVFSPAIVANGDVGVPDFVYYEILYSPTQIAMDWVKIEISSDGITWIPVFIWGDGIANTNSNVDISNPAFGGTEADNRAIDITSLYNGNTAGITVDIDSVPGIVTGTSYPWMRISGIGGVNGPDIDAIQVLP